MNMAIFIQQRFGCYKCIGLSNKLVLCFAFGRLDYANS